MISKNNSGGNSKKREANQEFLVRRQNYLRDNGAAQAALQKMRVGKNVQKDFYLGLSDQYVDSQGIIHENALIAPIINAFGKPTKQSVYFNLPGITVNPVADFFWTRGEAQTYYSGSSGTGKTLIVCGDIPSLWLLYDVLSSGEKQSDRNLNFLLIASSDPKSFPKEWKKREFWSEFTDIYFAFPNDAEGDKSASKAAETAAMPTKRLRLPKEFDRSRTNISLETQLTLGEFDELIIEVEPVGAKIKSELNDVAPGRCGYHPVDIAGTFHNGHLYYPVRTLNNVLDQYHDESGGAVSQVSSRTEVVLIRSDRTVQTVYEVPAPRGTPLDERVLRLSDGTLIESRPKASIHSTWSWKSIKKFCSAKSRTRSLKAILADVKIFLKRAVWLPFERDYDLLTLLVPVTFSQAIFKAVPLVLVTGAPGSGKSALGTAMVKICANASTIGQISAAAVARLIDETKGFVVFDDLESIGRRKGREAASYTELVQALKLSYNRETSWKTWTDVSRGMSVKRLNFYGVKMLNNTTGTDDILGSRVLKIFTRKVPVELQNSLGMLDPNDEIELKNLRDELHTWTFQNVNLIDQTYQRLFPSSTDRTAEIFAPLRVFAELSEDEQLQAGLIRALEFQNAVLDDSINPVEIMKESVKRLIMDGQLQISATQVIFEMDEIISDKPCANFDQASKWRSPVWIGRQLRTQDLIEINASLTRQSVNGKYVRVYPLRKEYVSRILGEG